MIHKMKSGIRNRIKALMQILGHGESARSLRSFCHQHGINYVSVANSCTKDSMGIGLADAFKKAVPELNMNWFLYGEGPVCLPHAYHGYSKKLQTK